MYCTKCGVPHNSNAAFCPQCGEKVDKWGQPLSDTQKAGSSLFSLPAKEFLGRKGVNIFLRLLSTLIASAVYFVFANGALVTRDMATLAAWTMGPILGICIACIYLEIRDKPLTNMVIYQSSCLGIAILFVALKAWKSPTFYTALEALGGAAVMAAFFSLVIWLATFSALGRGCTIVQQPK